METHLAIKLMATGKTFRLRDPSRYSLIFSDPKSCFRLCGVVAVVGKVGSASSSFFLLFLKLTQISWHGIVGTKARRRLT